MSEIKQQTRFEDVLRREHAEIGKIRENRGEKAASSSGADLVGLAFSGGGIRSATFNLGILQALARRNCLPAFDYLSTVSGGGYIGSWFVSWVRRRGLANVAAQLNSRGPAHQEATPVEFLRNYSNYLTPELGIFSPDTWTMLLIWLRNMVLNQAVLVSFLALVLLLPRLVHKLTVAAGWVETDIRFTVSTVLMAMAAAFICWNMDAFSCSQRAEMARRKAAGRCFWLGMRGVQFFILLPAVVAGWAGATALYYYVDDLRRLGPRAPLGELVPRLLAAMPEGTLNPLDAACVVAAAVVFALLTLVALRGGYVACFLSVKRRGKLPAYAAILLISAICSAFGGVLFYGVGRLFDYWITQNESLAPWHLTAWGAPLVLYVLSMVIVLHIGLLGKGMADDRREWWSRVGAQLFLWGLGCNFVFCVAVYGPCLVERLGVWANGISGGWLAASAASVISGFNRRTGPPVASSADKNSPWMNLLAKLGPPLYIVGLLVVLAFFENNLLAHLSGWGPGVNYWARMYTPTGLLVAAVAVTGTALAVLGWRVDVNEFSMHHFYRNRLVRCYLGASHEDRIPNPLTGFDNQDDIPLASFHSGYQNKDWPAWDGPLPIINTAINFNHGERLAWQERKAASFVFTPLATGFSETVLPETRPKGFEAVSYRPTWRYGYVRRGKPEGESGPSIGTAMAISGAAVSPNMGYHTSGAVAFLLTMFNVRLGWWLANPSWTRSLDWYGGPGWGFWYLLKELAGNTTVKTKFVYLSDGGHFENLAIYELVRRKCRLIIACDAEEDGEFTFNGLGNAIRKCRNDFGVEIELNVDCLRSRQNGRCREHFAVGWIHYREGPPGTLVYIKSSLADDNEPNDIQEYASRETAFPHQSTGDQFFDESQFESYRALGHHVGLAVFPEQRAGDDAGNIRNGLIDHFEKARRA